jgi:2-dehydropantoate 2-reductase
MRIAVFGAGAVGAYVGGRLAQAGEQVALIARGEHLDAIRRHGLRVESPHGDVVIRPWLATNDPTQVGVVDVKYRKFKV